MNEDGFLFIHDRSKVGPSSILNPAQANRGLQDMIIRGGENMRVLSFVVSGRGPFLTIAGTPITDTPSKSKTQCSSTPP